MTDEEKAEEYAEKNIDIAISMYNPNATSLVEQAYLDGLTEGRKERNCVNCSNHGKQFEVMKLEKENEQLKQQIEKMKFCSNCKWFGDCSNDAFQNGYTFSTCSKCNKWELAE